MGSAGVGKQMPACACQALKMLQRPVLSVDDPGGTGAPGWHCLHLGPQAGSCRPTGLPPTCCRIVPPCPPASQRRRRMAGGPSVALLPSSCPLHKSSLPPLACPAPQFPNNPQHRALNLKFS